MDKNTGFEPSHKSQKIISSKKLGKKLDKLGDDDLFGELEPFDLDDHPTYGEQPTETGSQGDQETTKKPTMKQLLNSDKDKKFRNPMEKSKLMKKLKEDQDLFGTLDK